MITATEGVMMAVFLATVTNRLIDALVVPVFERYGWDKFFLKYVSWIFGAALILMTDIDLFTMIEWRYPIVGTVLTAIVVGGGANFIHDIFDEEAEKTS